MLGGVGNKPYAMLFTIILCYSRNIALHWRIQGGETQVRLCTYVIRMERLIADE